MSSMMIFRYFFLMIDMDDMNEKEWIKKEKKIRKKKANYIYTWTKI